MDDAPKTWRQLKAHRLDPVISKKALRIAKETHDNNMNIHLNLNLSSNCLTTFCKHSKNLPQNLSQKFHTIRLKSK